MQLINHGSKLKLIGHDAITLFQKIRQPMPDATKNTRMVQS